MNCSKPAGLRLGGIGAVLIAVSLTAVSLAGCASTPAKPVAPVVAPPPPPEPAIITMAPIPNPKPEKPVAHERTVRSHTSTAASAHGAASPATAHPAAPAGPSLDPAKAAQLRAKGLEELNRGAVGRAVALLTQASHLDPANAAIRRDLERAERINRAVNGAH